MLRSGDDEPDPERGIPLPLPLAALLVPDECPCVSSVSEGQPNERAL